MIKQMKIMTYWHNIFFQMKRAGATRLSAGTSWELARCGPGRSLSCKCIFSLF